MNEKKAKPTTNEKIEMPATYERALMMEYPWLKEKDLKDIRKKATPSKKDHPHYRPPEDGADDDDCDDPDEEVNEEAEEDRDTDPIDEDENGGGGCR